VSAGAAERRSPDRPFTELPAAPAAVLHLGAPAAPAVAAQILEFQATVLCHEKFDQAAAAFATEIAAMLNFDRAAIGFAAPGGTRVVATSHTADFKPHSELFSAFAGAWD
jgi:hypothetical protein